MGQVWKARDSRLDRTVAIKRLKGEHNARFEHEARAVAALNHPHICQIYDVGPDYLVLEYVEGTPLRGPLEVEEAQRLGSQIVDALEQAHARGILHRDLKPANILVTAKGVKLLDFGLAKLVAHVDVTRTEVGTVMGTAPYMSPEQARGMPVDARSDIFSFGAVLYELLSGSRAFGGDTVAQALSAVLLEDPPVLGSPLESVVVRCLAKDPAMRFQRVSDVRKALEGALARHAANASSGAIDSIAVLPFANNAKDPDVEYLCEGIAENIMNSLAQIPGLRVAPRSTVVRYKAHDVDPNLVGRELHVRTVLTGRVSQRGDNLLVGTELLDVAAGAQLWGERFQRKISDLFALEEEIARKISGSLRTRITGETKTVPAKRFTENTEAYQLYLRGRHHWTRRAPDHVRKGAEFFQKAIDKDPGYALAYSGLADCYSILAVYSVLPPREAFARAKAAAVAAVAFDADLAEAHTSLAFIRAYFDCDWAGAEAGFQRALELNPDYWVTRYWYALVLTSCARFDDAEAQIAHALALEPLSPVVMHGAAFNAYSAGRHALANERGRRGIDNDPHYFLLRIWQGLACQMNGQHTEAIAELEKAVEQSGGAVSWVWGYLANACAAAGLRDRAEGIVRDLLARQQQEVVEPVSLVHAYAGLGDHENALTWLERGVETRGMLPVLVKSDPLIRVLESEPRYQEVLRKFRLSP
jgi:TolB-like protein/tetratricopeptide (TPR) repeat protein